MVQMAVASASQPAIADATTRESLRRLRRANVLVGAVHVFQAAAILAISTDFSLSVTWAFSEGPPGSPVPPRDELFDLPLGPAVAAFLLLAAIDHLAVAAPRAVHWYERHLLAERNYARWAEYALSASLMVVLIAMLAGISDEAALIAIAGTNSAMICVGLLMERVNHRRARVDWSPF